MPWCFAPFMLIVWLLLGMVAVGSCLWLFRVILLGWAWWLLFVFGWLGGGLFVSLVCPLWFDLDLNYV